MFLYHVFARFIVCLKTGGNSSKVWWPSAAVNPNIMYVRPTVCDRDHERLAGFTHVSPRAADVTFVFAGV